MSIPFAHRVLKRKEDSISDDHTSSTHSVASATTRRRKVLRRVARSSQQLQARTHFEEHYDHIRLLGRVDAYSQLNPELVTADPDPAVHRYSLDNPPPIPGFKPEQWTFVKACTPVEMAHLKHFDRPDCLPPNDDAKILERAAGVVADLLDLPEYLQFPYRQDLREVKFYPNKFAGIEYAVMGLKTRGDADPVAQRDAEEAYDRLLAGHRVPPHDVRLGGRGKVTRMAEEEGESKVPAVGRLILMLSHRDLKLCGITESLLTKAWSASKYPIAVGQSWYHGGVDEFLRRFLPHEKFYCFDAKKFDSSINPWMVRIAINTCRTQFYEGMDHRFDAYWDFIEESLLRAPIYRDDGLRFQKFVGTTSGHSHNTLLQSIITLLLGYACLMILNPEMSDEDIMANAWLESLGDDNIMGLSGDLTRHTVEDIATVMQGHFNVNWFGKKSFATTRLIDPHQGEFQGVQFLGKYFYLGDYPAGDGPVQVPLPYRPAEETYLRLLYPEYGDLVMEGSWLRALGNYLDAAGNRAMEAWLQGYMDWLEPQLEREPETWPANFKRMVTRDYSNVGVEVPKPERISFEQWRDLVVLGREEYRRLWRVERGQVL